MRWILALMVCLLVYSSPAAGQFNYYKTTYAVSSGFTRLAGDVKRARTPRPVVGFTIGYQPAWSVQCGVELSSGTLQAGDSLYERDQRFSKMRMETAALFLRWQPFTPYPRRRALLKHWPLGYFAGFGIGIISSRVAEIRRTGIRPDGSVYMYPGADRSRHGVFRAETGLNYFVKNHFNRYRYVVQLKSQAFMADGEGIDGYDEPALSFRNRHYDFFGTVTLGVGFFFGPLGLQN